MDLLGLGGVRQLAEGLAGLPMFPYFDTAHYIVSVMALREQPGALEVSQRSPFACWFSSMLYCFGGAVLSGIILSEAPVAPLANSTNILLASLMWYLVFYCPLDAVYSCATVLPVRLVLTGMKEVTRTWKILGGVVQANKKYKDGLFVMIAVGWAKGAGGGLISNFEQLVRGVWKPETNELLKMSYPTKVTLIGAVLFSLQQCHYLPLRTPELMLIYTVFIVVNKSLPLYSLYLSAISLYSLFLSAVSLYSLYLSTVSSSLQSLSTVSTSLQSLPLYSLFLQSLPLYSLYLSTVSFYSLDCIESHGYIFRTRMMLMGSSSSPFAPVESALYRTLFARSLPYSPVTNQSQSPTQTPSCLAHPDSKGASSVPNGSPQSEEAADSRESESSKKTN
ncbi:hypothetical protein NFI96_028506 [Prochilodus magdalenae]|nr:hypothetical protein NFI96_028506 [Prochilodus magdalenae]